MTAPSTAAEDGLSRGLRRFLAQQASPWVKAEVEAIRREAAGQRHRRREAEARANALGRRQVKWLQQELGNVEQQLRDAVSEQGGTE